MHVRKEIAVRKIIIILDVISAQFSLIGMRKCERYIFHAFNGQRCTANSRPEPFYLISEPSIELKTLPHGLNPKERETLPEDD